MLECRPSVRWSARIRLAHRRVSQPNSRRIIAWLQFNSSRKKKFPLFYVHIPGPEGAEEAFPLVEPAGGDALIGEGGVDDLYKALQTAPCDEKALVQGRLVNKRARQNLCYADFDQEPDVAQGKETVVDFRRVPSLDCLRRRLQEPFGPKGVNLVAELNRYDDPAKKNGIGFHGDAERRIVVGVRLGPEHPLVFEWYRQYERTGRRFEVSLGGGDLYAMSEKAVGYDWRRSSIYTLRHAAGAEKYTK